MIRRFGEAIVPGQSYRARPGAYAVISDGAGVLLTHQSQPHSEFQLPGGGIDPGESPLQALYREVLEETGYTVHAPRRLGAYRRFVFMGEYGFWAEKICHIYLARVGRRHGEPHEAGHSAHWVNPVDAMGLIKNDGDRSYLSRVFN
ncbi:MAG: NUDIX hydrolase [Litoreibacter sp.]